MRTLCRPALPCALRPFGTPLLLSMFAAPLACTGAGAKGDPTQTPLASNDIDGDGTPNDADCADEDPAIHPGAAEIWYDGVDADCAGDSDFDADGDGQDSDAYGGTDCDDTDHTTYDGAADTWYDGVDADCAGDSDFDADGDGQDSDAHGGTDCADTDADVYGGAPETWYDGVDSDCAGDSDFDADGDGQDSDAHGGNDCDDTDDTTYHGAPETWYDGVDADCAGDSDFDADGDGQDSDAYGGIDCDDTDADTFDGALEVCGDGVQQSCDAAAFIQTCIFGETTLDARASLRGAALAERAGRHVAAAGDTDGDRVPDLVIGADLSSVTASVSGAVYVISGSVSGALTLPTGGGVRYGTAAGDWTGNAVGGGGDMDLDGLDDVVVGAPNTDERGSDAGSAYVLAGPVTGTGQLADATAHLLGVDAGDSAGISVSLAGDLQGDGPADVVIGAYYASTVASYAGAVYVMNGPVTGTIGLESADATIHGTASVQFLGATVHSSADLDGDGIHDLLVGAPSYAVGSDRVGGACIAYGPLSGTSSLASADCVVGDDAGDALGQSAVGIGDFNGDGMEDLAAGAYGDDDGGASAGAVHVFFGPVTAGQAAATADLHLIGSSASDILGVYLPGAGDVDGDGFSDLVAGSANYDGAGDNAGGIFVLLGPATGTVQAADADLVVDGAPGEKAGYTSAFVGDTDGDGTDDLLVGALDANLGGQTEGAAYLLVGSTP